MTDIPGVFSGAVTAGPGGTVAGTQLTAGTGNEVQTLTFGSATDNTSVFSLTFGERTTSAIAGGATFAATAANIQTALEALPNVGAGNVRVLGTDASTFRVIFTGASGQVDIPGTITGVVTAGAGTSISGVQTTLGTTVNAAIRLDAGILAAGHNNALGGGAATLHVNGTSNLIAVNGNRTLANDLVINSGVTLTLGDRRDFAGTDDLTLTGNGYLNASATAFQTTTLQVLDNQTNVTLTGRIAGGGDFLTLQKSGIGTLTLAGNNGFDVADSTGGGTILGTQAGINVANGILRISHSNALGAGDGQYSDVHIRSDAAGGGAALEIDGTAGPVNITNRNLVIFHQNQNTTDTNNPLVVARGFLNRSSTGDVHTGVVRNLAGNNSITGQIDLRTNTGTTSEAGRAATTVFGADAGKLTLNGQIFGTINDSAGTVANNRSLIKTGAGTVETSGADVGNEVQRLTFTGTPGATQTFTYTFNAVSTAAIAYGASDAAAAAAIEAALNGLSTIGGVGGSVKVGYAGSFTTGRLFHITFGGTLANMDAAQIGAALGTGTGATAVAGSTLSTIATRGNTITGNYLVLGGTLELNKTNTGGTNHAVNGTLTIGDDAGGANADRVVIAQSNQVQDSRAVTVRSSGQLAFAAGASDAFSGVISMIVGNDSGANIDFGAGVSLNNDVTVTYLPGTTSTTTGATITGTLNLPANRTFIVQDGPGIHDLKVDAVVSSSGLFGIIKGGTAVSGTGRMTLTNANTYSGTTTVNFGILQVSNATALGNGVGTNEVQTVVANNATGNTVSFGGRATATITNATTVAAMQTQMDGIVGVGNSLVAGVTGNFTITFIGELANHDVEPLVAAGTNVTVTQTTTGVGGTVVASGAVVELANNITVTGEALRIAGNGILNAQNSSLVTTAYGSGALRNVGGTNTWAGSITLNGANGAYGSIGVDSGTNLTVNGTILQQIANVGLVKTGLGLLELAGSQHNQYIGATFVNEGTVRLNKAGGFTAIRGSLFIGDNRGGDNADLVVYASTAGTNQLNDVAVFINSTGRLDLNNVDDTNNNAIILGVGPSASGDIVTGTGVLISNNNITTQVMGGITGASPAATISGVYSLNNGDRAILVHRSGAMTHELDIQARMYNGGVHKTAQGTLLLSGQNSFDGVTSVFNGTLVVGHDQALATGNELQRVVVPVTRTEFRLSFGGQQTAIINRTIDDGASVQAKLEALANIGVGRVSVAGGVGGPYVITFQGTLGATDVATLTAVNVTGSGTVAIATLDGGNTSVQGTTVADGASLVLNGGRTLAAGEAIFAAGDGFEGGGAIRSTGSNTIAGAVNLYQGHRDAETVVTSGTVGGVLTLSGAVTLHNATLAIEGAGDVTVSGNITGNPTNAATFNAWDARYHDITGVGAVNVTGNINSTLADPLNPHNVRRLLFGQVNIVSDTNIDTDSGLQLNGLDSLWTAVWTTEFTPDESGQWAFRTNGAIDDNASIWLDANRNGSFELNERLSVRSGAGQTVPAGLSTALVAGDTYLLAIAANDTSTGGAFPDLEFARPSAPTTFVNADPAANPGLFTVAGGKDGITQNGTGILTLSGNNTYFGDTTVNDGTLRLTQGAAIGDNGSPTAANGSLILNSPGQLDIELGENTGVLHHTVTVEGNYTQIDGLTFDINGALSDSIVVNGTVTLDATKAAPVFTSTTAPSALIYTLIANDGTDPVVGTFQGLSDGASVTVNGVPHKIFYGGGDGNDVVLVNATTPTVVYVDDSWAMGINGGQTIADADLGTTADQGAIFKINAFATLAEAIAAVGTGGTIIVNGGTYAETVTLNNGKTLEVTGPDANQTVIINSLTTAAGTNVIIEGTSNLTVGDGTSTTIAGTIQGSGSLTKAGSGTVTISGDNNYSGLTTVSVGTLKLGHLNALGGTGSGTTILSGATLDLNGVYASGNSNEAITVSGTGVGGNGAIVNTGAAIVNQGFGNLTLAGDTTIGGSVRWDIRGGITFTGNNHTLTKTGSFEFAVSSPLNGADIVLNGGLFVIQTANALGTGGPTDTTTVNSGATLANWGTLTVPEEIIFNGGSLNSLNGSATYSGPITLNATTNVTTAAGGHNITLSGVVDGAGGLTKLGSSTLTLSNANTYAGATAINAGTLELSGGSAIVNTGAVSIANVAGATLKLNASETIGSLAGGGTTGGAVNLQSFTLTTGDATNTAFAGVISGTGGLTKIGAGTLSLNGNNTYDGATAVSVGTLLVNGDSSAANGTVTVSSGANLGGTGTIGGIVTALAGSNVQPGVSGVGELTVNANVTLQGDLDIDVNGATADQLDVNGTVTLGGTLTFNNIADPTAYIITLIDNDGNADLTTGLFTGINDGDTVMLGAAEYRLFYNGGDGNDVILVSTGAPGTIYVDDDFTGTQGLFIDGDLEDAGQQFAIYDVSAFNSVAAALAKYANYSGTIVVNGGTYASALDLTSASNGAGAIALRFVNDLTNLESAVVTTAFNGDATDSLDTSLHNATGIGLATTGGAFHGVISGLGGITFNDGVAENTLTLSGANTYSGATTVVDGTLSVTNTTGSATGSGLVTVQSGSSLIGTGSIGGDVTVHAGATVEPGIADIATIGTGNLVLGSGSTLVIQMSNAPSNDRVNAVGTVTLNGGDLDLIKLGTAPTTGTLTLIDNDGTDAVVGTFNGLAEGSLIAVNIGTEAAPIAGTVFRISYKGGTGNDVVLTALAQATTGVSVDGNGNLVIDDVLGAEDTPDRLFIGIVNGVLVIRDPNNALGNTVNGGQQTGLNEVRINPALFNNLIINTGGGNDIITLGNLVGLGGSVLIDGDAGFDQINLSASTVTLGAGFMVDFSAEQIVIDRSTITVSGTGSIDLDATRSGADGAGLTYHGINLTGSTLTATGSGSVSLDGQGGGTGGTGLYIQNGSSINASGSSGSVTLIGTGGGGTGANNAGVVTTYSSIAAGPGNLLIQGSGGTGAGGGHQGVNIVATPVSRNGAGGTLTINGTGGSGGGANYGVQIDYTSSLTSNGGDGIAITGQAGSGGSYNHGVVTNRNVVLSTNSGPISITGTGGGTGSQSSGIDLKSATIASATSVTLAGAASATPGGTMNYGTSISSSNVTAANGNMTITGTAGTGTGGNSGVAIGTSTLLRNGAGILTINGTGGSGGGSNYGVSIDYTSSLTSNGGSGIAITGQAGSGAGGYNYGVVTNRNVVLSTNSGPISITGTGGGTGSQSSGIDLKYATINSATSVTLAGAASATPGGTMNHGTSVSNSNVTASNGNMMITGTAGTGTGGNSGVTIGTSTLLRNGAGTLTINGTGGAGGATNYGVSIDYSATLTSNGGSGILVAGTGGNGTNTNVGVIMNRNVILTTDAGISITGTGRGSGHYNAGINLTSARLSAATTVTIAGTGSATATGTFNVGAAFASSNITANNGDMSITGQAGTGTSGNSGVTFTSTTLLRNGAGTLTINGTGTGSTTANHGVQIDYITSMTSNGGSGILLTGQGGSGTSGNHGITTNRTVNLSTNSGGITLIGTGNGSAGANVGVNLLSTNINSAGGLNITGTGSQTAVGAVLGNSGVFLGATSLTANGALAITGHGGRGSSNNRGVEIGSASSVIGGSIAMVGIAHASTTGTGNAGIWLTSSALNSTGAFTINGTGGGGTGLNHGIFMQTITNLGGPITRTGLKGAGATSLDIAGNFI